MTKRQCCDIGTHQSIAVRGGKPSIISQEMPRVLPRRPYIQTTCIGLSPTREIRNNLEGIARRHGHGITGQHASTSTTGPVTFRPGLPSGGRV